MRTYSLTIGGLSRNLPIVDISKHLSVATLLILGDTKLIETVAPLLAHKLPPVDILVTVESKSQALAYELSKCLQHDKFIVARRNLQPYMRDPLIRSVESMDVDDCRTLYLDGPDADYLKGKRVALVDDIISRGRSLNALKKLIEECQGEVITQAAILAEGRAAQRKDIVYLAQLPLFNNSSTPHVMQ